MATFSGPDLRTGLGLLAKFGQTRTDFFNITISEHTEGLKVNFAETFDLDDLRVFVTESVFSGLFSAITFFAGVGQFSGQICFAYPEPTYGKKYHDHFGDNIKFNQPATEIIVPESILSTPSPTADPVLHQEAVAICERQLKEIKGGEAGSLVSSTEETVSTLIFDNPGKIWTLNEVAARLSMSPRTLIRKLESEGTKFQRVRDEMAKKQVANYLTDASLSVESIGHLMGFSDVSSFRRSFKRWFGETPSQYIARARGVSRKVSAERFPGQGEWVTPYSSTFMRVSFSLLSCDPLPARASAQTAAPFPQGPPASVTRGTRNGIAGRQYQNLEQPAHGNYSRSARTCIIRCDVSSPEFWFWPVTKRCSSSTTTWVAN